MVMISEGERDGNRRTSIDNEKIFLYLFTPYVVDHKFQ